MPAMASSTRRSDTRADASVQSVAVGDFNEDGRLDIAAVTQDTSDAIILINTAAGDANRDGWFNQLDIVSILQAGRYLTGQVANWSEGDWNRDGVFDQLDLVLALQEGNYLSEPKHCWGNDMCADDEYCYFADCAAETGTCRLCPENCITLWTRCAAVMATRTATTVKRRLQAFRSMTAASVAARPSSRETPQSPTSPALTSTPRFSPPTRSTATPSSDGSSGVVTARRGIGTGPPKVTGGRTARTRPAHTGGPGTTWRTLEGVSHVELSTDRRHSTG